MVPATVHDAVQNIPLSLGPVWFLNLLSPGDFVQLGGTMYTVRYVVHAWGDGGMPAVSVHVTPS